MLRALRLIKLVRLLRASRILRRWETRVAVNYSLLALAKCVVGMMLLSHWFACVRGLLAGLQDNILHSWEGDELYCRNVTTDDAPHYRDGVHKYSDPSAAEAACEIQCDPPGVLYVAALHWSVTTVLGEASASAGNTVEMAVATGLMLLGSMAWSATQRLKP